MTDLTKQGVRNLNSPCNGRVRHSHRWIPVTVSRVDRTFGFGEVYEKIEFHCIDCPAVRDSRVL